jgi:hypothetical protein
MLEVVLPLPLSPSMYDGELDHSGGGGGGGGPVLAVEATVAAVAAVAAVAVVEDNYWRKWPATRGWTVA